MSVCYVHKNTPEGMAVQTALMEAMDGSTEWGCPMCSEERLQKVVKAKADFRRQARIAIIITIVVVVIDLLESFWLWGGSYTGNFWECLGFTVYLDLLGGLILLLGWMGFVFQDDYIPEDGPSYYWAKILGGGWMGACGAAIVALFIAARWLK